MPPPSARRVAVVTGSCSTTSAEVALRLAEFGMDVALLDPAAGAHDPLVDRIRERGGRARAIPADAADTDAVASALAEVTAEWGEPRVLVNVVNPVSPANPLNAAHPVSTAGSADGPGTADGERLCGMTDARWEAAATRPLRGVFVASRLAVDLMCEAGSGCVVTVAPPLAGDGSEHSTLRAGLEGFTATIALELEAFGVTANLIAPRRPQVGLHSDPASGGLPGGAARYARAVADAVPALLGAKGAVTGQVVYVGADVTD